MTEKELIALLESAGYTVRKLSGGRYVVISPNPSVQAQYFDSLQAMQDYYTRRKGAPEGEGPRVVVDTKTSPDYDFIYIWDDPSDPSSPPRVVVQKKTKGVVYLPTPEVWTDENGLSWVRYEKGGQPKQITLPKVAEVLTLTFRNTREAYRYIEEEGLTGLEPYWDERYDAYRLRDITAPTEPLGWEERPEADAALEAKGDPNLMVAWDAQTQRYYLVNKPKDPDAKAGYATRAEAEADLAVKGDPTLKIFFDTGTQRYFLSQPAAVEPEPEPYRGLEAPEFWTDRTTGQRYVKTTPEGPWESFNEYIPSFDQQINRLLAQGTPESVARAQSLMDFKNQPTQAEALRLGMEIMQSPGDWWTYMKMTRGTQPNVPYDVYGQTIPGWNMPALSLGQTGLPGMPFGPTQGVPVGGGMPTLTAPAFQYPKPRPEDVARQEAMRKWALEPWPGTIGMPQAPGIRRPYIFNDAGDKEYITEAQAKLYESQGYGNYVKWETTAPPTLQGFPGAAGYREVWPLPGEPGTSPMEPAYPSMGQRIAAYQTSRYPAGYEYHPINEQEGYETIYGVPTDPSRRAGYVPPSTSLAQALQSPQGITPTEPSVTSTLQVPTFLSELAAGRNVGRARPMSTMGFPPSPSAQGWRNLTIPERQIMQAEVKPAYWPQYEREMQELWPSWNKRGAFLRAPARIGG